MSKRKKIKEENLKKEKKEKNNSNEREKGSLKKIMLLFLFNI